MTVCKDHLSHTTSPYNSHFRPRIAIVGRALATLRNSLSTRLTLRFYQDRRSHPCPGPMQIPLLLL
ncbi:hypothetical protein FOXYSP1_12158 [Fusarium oxysporum f. sp. phaseoli]